MLPAGVVFWDIIFWKALPLFHSRSTFCVFVRQHESVFCTEAVQSTRALLPACDGHAWHHSCFKRLAKQWAHWHPVMASPHTWLLNALITASKFHSKFRLQWYTLVQVLLQVSCSATCLLCGSGRGWNAPWVAPHQWSHAWVCHFASVVKGLEVDHRHQMINKVRMTW